jgi:transforming growth factor-beta-induced protein
MRSTKNMKRTSAATIGLAGLAMFGVACGSSKTTVTPKSTTAAPAATTTAAPKATTATTAAPSAASGSKNFGSACSAVPASGAGSFDGMAKDPAATAASHNPVLSTLVAAVSAAGLVDTLNGAGPFTIFAPSNDAFAKIDKATIDKLLADPKGDLTKILTLHVIAGQKLDADALVKAGSVKTVNGADVKITKTGDTYMVNGAKVVCGNVQTANATVMIIDTVLLPS